MNTIHDLRLSRRFLTCVVLSLVLAVYAVPASANGNPEVQELRQMVLALQAEVAALKAQLTPEPEAAPEAADTQGSPAEKVQVRSRYGAEIYGYFKLDAYHDSGVTSHQEIPFWAMPEDEHNNGEFDMTTKETRLGLDFSGPRVRGGEVTGKLELDFYGNVTKPGSIGSDHAYKLRTRHAYLNWAFEDWSILAGKTWEPYIISIPETLNFSYTNFQGQIGFRKTQLRFTREFELADDTSLTWIGALLDPWGGFCGADLDGDGQDDATDAELPVFATKLAYTSLLAGDRPAEFAFSAVYGKERFDVFDRDFDVWALSAGFVLPVSNRLTWKLSMYRGANLDSLWGNIGQGIYALNEIDGVGGWTQLQYRLSDDFRLNLGYSVDDPDDADLGAMARSRNQTYLLNAYYELGPSLSLGLEWLNLETSYKEAATARVNRLQSSLIYRY